MNGIAKVAVDGAIVAKRNLIKIKRVPDILVFTTISPIMFILLFAYVFGSAIDTSGLSYKEFLIPGIFAQTVVFGATFTGAGMADDIQKGIIDRFRSLPMSRSAVLVGRTSSDVGYNVVTLIVMSVTGLVIGWRIRTDVLHAIGAYLLLLAFAYAISWVMALIGLLVPSPEVVNNAAFIVIFPLTFIANTFVPTNELPLRAQGDRQLESGVDGDPGLAGTVRQHECGVAAEQRLVDAASGGLHAVVVRRPGRGLRAAVGAALQEGRRSLSGACAPPVPGRGARCPHQRAVRVPSRPWASPSGPALNQTVFGPPVAELPRSSAHSPSMTTG